MPDVQGSSRKRYATVRAVAATAALVTIALCGCSAKKLPITAPFDATQARAMLAAGSNTIAGSALIQQRGGAVITCAGGEVSLIPATPYAVERMTKLFGNSTNGFYSIRQSTYVFSPDYPEYHTARRTTVGDAQGMFEFVSVADGDYFVMVKITWMVESTAQGGLLMQRVSVAGGEVKRIVLSQ